MTLFFPAFSCRSVFPMSVLLINDDDDDDEYMTLLLAAACTAEAKRYSAVTPFDLSSCK